MLCSGKVTALAALPLLLLAGCSAGSKSSSSNTSGASSSSSKSTGNQGKTYTADSKGGAKGGQGGGRSSQGSGASSGGGGAQSGGGGSTSGGGSSPLPTPADTTNGKPSAASDDGSSDAVQGQAVMNPGAPVYTPLPAKKHAGSLQH